MFDFSTGAKAHKLISAATTNATSVKTKPGKLLSINAYNVAATVSWLKIYDKASAPTVGTDTPIMVIGLSPGTSVAASASPTQITFVEGVYLANGLAYAIVGTAAGIADSNTTAVGANEVAVTLTYQ